MATKSSWGPPAVRFTNTFTILILLVMSQQLFSRHSRELVLFVFSSAWAASGESFHHFQTGTDLCFASFLRKSWKVIKNYMSVISVMNPSWMARHGRRTCRSISAKVGMGFTCLNPSKIGCLGESCLVATRLGTKSMWRSKQTGHGIEMLMEDAIKYFVFSIV